MNAEHGRHFAVPPMRLANNYFLPFEGGILTTRKAAGTGSSPTLFRDFRVSTGKL
jgi:hypothetical protein